MSKTPAPSAKALLAQATALWPDRIRTSDGIVPSAAHTAANPTSDHEPGAAGYCHAVDLTHDPAHRCDCGAISESLRASGDPRRKYIIFNRRICSGPSWAWRPYSGSNPHDKHMHMSIIDTKTACEDVSPWPMQGGIMPDLTLRPGWQRFWRLTNPTATDRIYTADPAEASVLMTAGWHFDGPCFDISLTDPTNTRDLHRFLMGNGTHFFTADEAEASHIGAQSINAKHEGIVAKVGTGGVAVRRLYHEPYHLLTADPNENPTGFTYEGIAFGCGVTVVPSVTPPHTCPTDPHPSDANEQIAALEAKLDKARALFAEGMTLTAG